MPNSDSNDRHFTPHDEKQRIIDLTERTVTSPLSGIYDGGIIRYFAVNNDWLPIITGWMATLTEVASWQDAEDENYHAIQQIMKFIRGIEMAINCEDVENCLETSVIINNITITANDAQNDANGQANPQSATTDIQDGKNYSAANTPELNLTTCDDTDKDKLWGAISDFVDYCHNNNIDFIQELQNAVTLAEFSAKAIAAIPVIGLLTIDESEEIVFWLAQYLLNQYNVQVTTNGLYDYKCQLFCSAVTNDCQFSITDALSFFATDATIPTINTSNIVEILNTIADLTTLVGMEWFSAISALQLSLAVIGERFGNARGLSYYQKTILAGAQSPNNGWQIWCDDCNTPPTDWTIVLDFSGIYVPSLNDIVIRNPLDTLSLSGNASYSQSFTNGLKLTNPSNQTLTMQLNFSNTPSVQYIQWRWRSVTGSTVTADAETSVLYNVVRQSTTNQSFSTTAQVPLNSAGAAIMAVSYVKFFHSSILSSAANNQEVAWVKITGTGTLPIIV